MERIAIFGGTFNPVHIEHENVAKAAIAELKLDKLILMPTFLPPHKNVMPASAADRINMLKLAFCDWQKVEVSDFEAVNGGKSYSYLTAEHFKKLYPDSELFFIVGGDMLKDFKTWKFPERILAVANLAVVFREEYSFNADYEREYFKKTFGKDFILLRYSGKDVSSTEIRTNLAFGIKPHGINQSVFEYIKAKDVYPPDKYQKYIIDNLPFKRVIHTANVVICALKKAKELGLDEEKIRIAATLHDCAKYADVSSFPQFELPENVPPPVVHAFLGAFVAEHVLQVKDEEILDAIRYHTSGKADMSALAKLIFVADMVERGRSYTGVEDLRAEYERDFENCFIQCLKEETIHLKNKKQAIFVETLNAYEYYVNGKRR